MSEERIRKIVTIFRTVFLTFGVLGVLGLLVVLFFSFLGDSGVPGRLPYLVVVIAYDFSVYLGLKKRRSWVVPVVVFMSSMAIISLLFTQPTDLSLVIGRGVGLIFHVVTLYFFTRKDVRSYFKSHETTTFFA